MIGEDRRTTLDGAFQIGREGAIDALFQVLLAHQPAENPRPPTELRKRSQGVMIGLQETLCAGIHLPGFVEELGDVLCTVSDGTDEALLAVLLQCEDSLRSSIPPLLAEEMRHPIALTVMRLMLGWNSRRNLRETGTTSNAASMLQRMPEPASESLLAAVLDQAPVGTMVLDLEAGLPVVFTPGIERLFGYTLEEESTLPPDQMQNEDSADDDFDLLARMVAGRIPFVERRSARPHKDGHSVPFHLLAWPVRDVDGNVTHLAHQLSAAERQSPETSGSGIADRRARYLLQISPDPIVIAAPDGIIRFASPSVSSAMGLDPDRLVGQHVRVLVTAASEDAGRRMMQTVAATPRARIVQELESYRPDGSVRWFEVVATNLLDVAEVNGIVLQGRDITERRQLQDQLERTAHTDPLTALLNRRGFLDRLEAWLREPPEDDDRDRRRAAIAYIDIDDFKQINDQHGHLAGDHVLATVADRLRGVVAGRGFAGRFGGDEFVVFVEVADPAARDHVGRDLASALEGTVSLDQQAVVFGASFGLIDVAVVRDGPHNPTSDELLRDADRLLTAAKLSRKHPLIR